jgi:hypothetical protein
MFTVSELFERLGLQKSQVDFHYDPPGCGGYYRYRFYPNSFKYNLRLRLQNYNNEKVIIVYVSDEIQLKSILSDLIDNGVFPFRVIISSYVPLELLKEMNDFFKKREERDINEMLIIILGVLVLFLLLIKGQNRI